MNLLVFNLRTDADDHVLGFTTEWLNALAKRYTEIVVVTMAAGRIDVRPNVRVFSVGQEKGYSKLRRLLVFYRLLWRIVTDARVDACFAHMMPLFAVLGWPILRLRGIRTVLWYAHGQMPPIVKLAEHLVDRIVTSSRSGFSLPTQKLRIIGQGIDVERFAPTHPAQARSAECIILTVGRISRVKRLDLLIEALCRVPSRLPDGRLVKARIVGNPLTDDDVKCAASLAQLADGLGVRERVEFVQAQPFNKVHETYRGVDMFVNSSETNSVDKTVLEAMSSGLPVVTSNRAFREVLDSEVAQLCIVEHADSGALAQAISNVLRLPAGEQESLGRALRTIVVRDHSIDALCGRLVAEIEAACAV